MGSGFDFWQHLKPRHRPVTAEQEKNRNILRDAMVATGFEIYPEEWWHYKLKMNRMPGYIF